MFLSMVNQSIIYNIYDTAFFVPKNQDFFQKKSNFIPYLKQKQPLFLKHSFSTYIKSITV